MKNSVLTILFATSLLLCGEAFQPISRIPSFALAPVTTTKSNKVATSDFASTTRTSSRTQLFSATNTENEYDVDFDAIVKYTVAGIVQMGGLYCLLSVMDKGVSAFDFAPPLWANCLFFYACSLKSRVFNPLKNERPKVANPLEVELERPSWTPPGVFFPIMWLLIIGPVRAYSSAVVVDAAGSYATIATLSFLLHLSIGDIWNTINNVEKRRGAAASGVIFVIISAANAAYQYYQVDPTAGELLGATLLWLCTAGALVNSIWQLNPDQATGQKDALYPVKGEVETKYAWFNTDN
jgi:benzodiazapine receptor